MNTKLITLATYCLAIANVVFPQSYFYNDRYYDKDLLYEINLSLGAMNCLTDLGGRKGRGGGFLKDLNPQHTRLTAGIGAGFVYRYTAGLRIDLNAGTLYANDNVLEKDASEARYRYMRNLHFRTGIFELLAVAELFPMSLARPSGGRSPRLSPYLSAGVGVFWFNPEASLNGIWVRLQPLRTEGQGFEEYPDRKPYSLIQMNFPVGLGLKYELSAFFNMKLEILHRITTTDYLDDVSKTYVHHDLFRKYLKESDARLAETLHDRRGAFNPQHTATPGAIRGGRKKNDAYFSAVFKMSFVIGRERRFR